MELVVNERDQAVESRRISFAPGEEQSGDVR